MPAVPNRFSVRRLLCVVAMLLGALGIADPVGAQSATILNATSQTVATQTDVLPGATVDAPGPTEPEPLPLPESGTESIIPIPNSGPGPQNQGDPGTMSQYIVMVLTFGGLVAIVGLIALESRKKRNLTTASLSDASGAETSETSETTT